MFINLLLSMYVPTLIFNINFEESGHVIKSS